MTIGGKHSAHGASRRTKAVMLALVAVLAFSSISLFAISDDDSNTDSLDAATPGAVGYVFNSGGANYIVTTVSPRTAGLHNVPGNPSSFTIPEIVVDTSDGNKTYSVTSISVDAFKNNTNLTSISIPSYIKNVGASAFSGCSSLSALTLGEDQTIGSFAFENCVSLGPTVTIPFNTGIGSGTFHGCSGITAFAVEGTRLIEVDGVIYSGSKTSLVAYPAGKQDPHYTVAFADCSTLGTASFNGNKHLETIDLVNVTYIGGSVFLGCTGLKTLDLTGTSVKVIDSAAFSGCTGLTMVKLNDDIQKLGNNVFLSCSGLVTLDLGNMSILDMGDIGEGIFRNCSNLTTVTIPDNLTVITKNMFYGCIKLQSIDLNNVVDIGAYGFFNCSALTDVPMTDSVRTIGDSAFRNCTSMKAPQFNNVIEIGPSAFKSCTSATFRSITIPGTVTLMGVSAFENCRNLETLDLSQTTLSFIDDTTFMNCVKLNNVSIPPAVKAIRTSAFQNCTALTNLNLGSVEYIGNSAFRSCIRLAAVTIPTSTVTIDVSAFENCTLLTSVDLGSVQNIGDFAFKNTKLMSVMIPSTVTSVGKGVFFDCNSLPSISVHPGNTMYASVSGVLVNTVSKTLVAYPAGASAMTYIVPSSVTNIGEFGFSGCDHLNGIAIPSGVASIGANAFEGCAGLNVITVPENTLISGSVPLTVVTVYYRGTSLVVAYTDNADIVASVAKDMDVIRSVTATSGSFSGPSLNAHPDGNEYRFTSPGISSAAYLSVLQSDLCDVTVNAGENGSATYEVYEDGALISSGTASYNDPKTFQMFADQELVITFQMDQGYKVRIFTVDGVDKTSAISGSSYTADVITDGMVLSAEFEIDTSVQYTVTASVGSGTGTITPPTQTVYGGSSATVTIDPGQGYIISTFTVNGSDKSSAIVNNTYTLPQILVNTDIAVTFVIDANAQYTVTASVGSGAGTITPPTQTVSGGNGTTVTISPGQGYIVSTFTVDGVDKKNGIVNSAYNTGPVLEDLTIIVTFVIDTNAQYTVTASVGSGAGTITPPTQTVYGGGTATVGITPDQGMRVMTLLVNGSDMKAYIIDGEYTIYPVLTNYTIVVTFVIDDGLQYTVTATVDGTGGQISPPVQTVYGGDDATVYITPSQGYIISTFTVNGSEKKDDIVNGTYTVTTVLENVTIVVTFVIDTSVQYVIAAFVDGSGGQISPESQAVAGGGTASVTVSPSQGYIVSTFTVDSIDRMNDIVNGEYTIDPVLYASVIIVTFEIDTDAQWTVDASVGSGAGTISPLTQTVYGGSSATVTIFPSQGYRVASFTVNGNDMKVYIVGGEYTISQTLRNYTIIVTFEIDTSIQYTVTASVDSGLGTITPPTQTVSGGGNATVVISPSQGYKVASFTVNGTDKKNDIVNGTYTVSSVISNIIILVTFEIDTSIQYTVTAHVGSGTGTISPTTQYVNGGGNATVTITPGPGYIISTFTVNGTDKKNDIVNGTYTALSIISNMEIVVTFMVNSTHYEVTILFEGTGTGRVHWETSEISGTLSGTGVIAVPMSDGSLTLLAEADAENAFIGWITAGDRIGQLGYSKTISSPVSITAVFEDNLEGDYSRVTVSVDAPGTGTVSWSYTALGETFTGSTRSAEQFYAPAGTVSFDSSPDTDHALSGWYLDDTEVGTDQQYVLNVQTATATVIGMFVRTYSADISLIGDGSADIETSDGDGTVSSSSPVSMIVKDGDSIQITFHPDTDWHIRSVTVNGSVVYPTGTEYTTTVSGMNVTIEILYERDPYVRVTHEGKGSISPDGNATIPTSGPDAGNVSFVITPETGFIVSSILVDGTVEYLPSGYTDGPVTVTITFSTSTNHTMNVVFTRVFYVVTVVQNDGGTLSPPGTGTGTPGTGTVHVALDGGQNFEITVDNGYVVFRVNVGNGTQTPVWDPTDGVWKFTVTPTDDITVSAEFTEGYYVDATAGTGGSISPSGYVAVVTGHQIFMFNTSAGYTIGTVTVGSIGQVTLQWNGSNWMYEMEVTQNDTINVTFVSGYDVTVTVKDDTGGMAAAEPAGPSYAYGETVTVTITPDEGYIVKSVTDNGIATAVTDNGDGTFGYTFKVYEDHDVIVAFETEAIGPSGMSSAWWILLLILITALETCIICCYVYLRYEQEQ